MPALLALPIVFLLVLAVGIGQGKKRPATAPPTACLIVRRYEVLPASCRPASAAAHPLKLLGRSILTDGRQLPIAQGWIVSSVDLSEIVANGFLGNRCPYRRLGDKREGSPSRQLDTRLLLRSIPRGDQTDHQQTRRR